MNEKVTNLTPNTPTEEHSDSAEFKFNEQFYIAEGAAGLLAHVACHKELDGIPESVMASATYSLQDAIGKIGKMFEDLHEHCLSLQHQNKENAIATETILEVANHTTDINEDDNKHITPNIMSEKATKLAQAHDETTDFDWASIEGEFNHHHIIAKGSAGLLFRASEKDGHLNNTYINGAAYSIECALKEMDKMFEKLYLENTNIDMDHYDEFSDHYALAKSVAWLLFYVTEKTNCVTESFIVNPAAYSIESALKEMNKLFQSTLKSYLDATTCGRLK